MHLWTWNDFKRLEMPFGFKIVFQITYSLVNELQFTNFKIVIRRLHPEDTPRLSLNHH